ncbi:hypothetical protein J6590_066301 [Homalodisca vitripennis]|nr:hypothetical protein J6590_066301 [Homalodisca vitripennis]
MMDVSGLPATVTVVGKCHTHPRGDRGLIPHEEFGRVKLTSSQSINTHQYSLCPICMFISVEELSTVEMRPYHHQLSTNSKVEELSTVEMEAFYRTELKARLTQSMFISVEELSTVEIEALTSPFNYRTELKGGRVINCGDEGL